MKNPLKYLLLSSYSLAKYFVAKKKKQHVVIRGTIHLFTQIPTFLSISILFLIAGNLQFRIPIMPAILIFSSISVFGFHWYGKKMFYKWQIAKAYKELTKKQRRSRNTLLFIVFWIVFFMFFYIGVINIGGYKNHFDENGVRITTKK